MKKLILISVLVLGICGFVYATNTVNRTDKVVELSSIDSDWTWTSIYGASDHGQYLMSIIFKPGAADDKLSIKEASATGPEIFPSIKCLDEYDVKVKYYYGAKYRPYLDYSDSTISAGGEVIIEFGKP